MPAAASVCATYELTRLRPSPGGTPGLTAFPVTGFHAPAIALPHPLMGNPMVTGTWRSPVTRDPFMSIANPVPVAAQPHISGSRCNADEFHPRCRGGDHHHAIGIMPLIGNDHAPRERRRKHQSGCQAGDQPLPLIHNEDHMLLRVSSDLTCCAWRR